MARRGARWAMLIIAVFSLLLQLSWFAVYTKADSAASLLSSTPSVTQVAAVSSADLLSAPACNNTKINVVRSVLNNYVANEEQHCLYSTLYGLTDGTIIQPNGFGKAYPININLGGNPFLRPIPNQESMLFGIGDRSFPGVDIGLYKNFYQHLHFNYFYQQFDLSDSPDLFFRYSDNRQIAFNTIQFSDNGQYILADMPHQGFVRIDLSTLAIKPVAGALPLINNTGLLGAATTIDSTGRYAAIAYASPGGWGAPFLKIIDMDSCSDIMPATEYDSLITHCQSVSDLSWLKQQIPGLQTIQGVFFENQTTLLFDAALDGGAYGRYALTPGGVPVSTEQYLAMGDSYISGEGAFSYREGTDTSTNKCHQSILSYPYIIGSKLFDSHASVACSGAVMQNITARDDEAFQVNGGKIQPTSEEMKVARNDHVPGVLSQKDFVKQDNPNIVTLSIGGNDIGFSDIIKRCILPFDNFSSTSQNCYQTYESRLELVNLINSKFNDLTNTYKTAVNNDPARHIYVIGYPQVVSPTGSCSVNVRLSAPDRLFANQLISYLDQVIQQAAKNAGVYYVDTQNALAGHELCEDGTPAMNGLTIGDDKDIIFGNESYHPNALGQQLLGDAIMSKTHDLTTTMPTADSNITAPATTDSLDILQAPKTGRTVYNVLNTGQDVAVYLREGGPVQFTVDSFTGLLAPNTSFDVVLHSNPIDLGATKTTATGAISANIMIPAGTIPGFHTLHFYGTDIADNPVDVQQTIYVKASTNDADGDEIPDALDSCEYLPDSGVDADMDGIDDVCDAVVNNAPAKIVDPSKGINDSSVSSETSTTDFTALLPAVVTLPMLGQTDIATEEGAARLLGASSGIGTAAKTSRVPNGLQALNKEHKSTTVLSKATLIVALFTISLLALVTKKRRV